MHDTPCHDFRTWQPKCMRVRLPSMLRRWKRLDFTGLEIISLSEDAEGWRAQSVIADGGDEPFGMKCEWRLDRDWRSRSLDLSCFDAAGERALTIVRAGPKSWRIDGAERPDLEGCEEIDLSATPFCNGLALKRLGHEPGEMIALYVLAPALTVEPSRQRYEKLSERQWRYVDLGAAKGFTAVLDFDFEGFVLHYEGLFEALG
jgi:hypothetical protein